MLGTQTAVPSPNLLGIVSRGTFFFFATSFAPSAIPSFFVAFRGICMAGMDEEGRSSKARSRKFLKYAMASPLASGYGFAAARLIRSCCPALLDFLGLPAELSYVG